MLTEDYLGKSEHRLTLQSEGKSPQTLVAYEDQLSHFIFELALLK